MTDNNFRLPEEEKERRTNAVRQRFENATTNPDIYVPKQRIPMHTGNDGPINILKYALGGIASAGILIYAFPKNKPSIIEKAGTVTSEQMLHSGILFVLAAIFVLCIGLTLREFKLTRRQIQLGIFVAAGVMSAPVFYGLRLIFNG